MTQGQVAVVIVNYRTPELAAGCARAVAETTSLPELEVVVVDNASADGSVERLRDAGIRVFEQARNGGFAYGVNAGFAGTTAPIVVVLNPDAVPEARAIDRLVEHLQANPRTAIAAPLLVDSRGEIQRSGHKRFPNLFTFFVDFCLPVSFALHLAPSLHPHELGAERSALGGEVEHATGAALAIRREAYVDAGPLDEGFFLYLEETEWQRRVRARGWKIELVPEARVVHLIRGGDDSAYLPSPHYLASVYRYLALRGVGEGRTDAMLLAASGMSRVAMRLLALAVPSRREEWLQRLDYFRGLSREVRARRRRRR